MNNADITADGDNVASVGVGAKIIAQRQETHGDYHEVAEFSQTLKNMFRDKIGRHRWKETAPEITESLEMIAVKLARIVCGDAAQVQHFEDIAGYSALVVRYLEGVRDE